MKCYEFEVWYNVRLYNGWGDRKPKCKKVSGSVFVNSDKEALELLEHVKGNKHSYLHIRFVKVTDEKLNPLAKSEKEFMECAKCGPCMRPSATLKCYEIRLFYEFEFFSDSDERVCAPQYNRKSLFVNSYRDGEDLLHFIEENAELDKYLQVRLQGTSSDTSKGISEEDLIWQLKSMRLTIPF